MQGGAAAPAASAGLAVVVSLHQELLRAEGRMRVTELSKFLGSLMLPERLPRGVSDPVQLGEAALSLLEPSDLPAYLHLLERDLAYRAERLRRLQEAVAGLKSGSSGGAGATGRR